MNMENKQSNLEFNAESEITYWEQQAFRMGNNDTEKDLFNRIRDDYRNKKITAQEAAFRAQAVVNNKQDH